MRGEYLKSQGRHGRQKIEEEPARGGGRNERWKHQRTLGEEIQYVPHGKDQAGKEKR